MEEAMRVYEAMARVDGSAGWCLAIGATGALIAQWLQRESYEEFLAKPRNVLAGSTNPAHTRVDIKDGVYVFSGKGTFGSSVFFATHVPTSGVIFENGEPKMNGSAPVTLSGVLPRDSVTVLDTWSVSGLGGTGSNDFVYRGVEVPERWTFHWAEGRHLPGGGRGYQNLPTSLGGPIAAVCLGIAQHGLDLLVDLAATKIPAGQAGRLRDRPNLQIAVAQAEMALQSARSYLYEVTAEMTAAEARRDPVDMRQRARWRLALMHASQGTAKAIDLVWKSAGATAIYRNAGIERCWRDLHAATQHVILQANAEIPAGRAYLGMDPGSPTF
jgi:alkylation response protein AidB-like acyl-CoA dehydrogenase